MRDFSNLSKEELIEEIEKLNDQLSQYENPEDDDNPLGEMLSSLMNFGGFDMTSIQTEFITSMINNIPNPAFIKDPHGIFLGCNKQFELFMQSSGSQIIGKTTEEIFPAELVALEVERDKRIVENNEILNYETEYRDQLGEQKNIIVSKSIYNNLDGTVAGILGVIYDITEKRRAERALVESEKRLRDANATKDKFFSIISHDLKNPFTSLLGFSNILITDFESLENDEVKSFLNEIENAAKFAYSLLENILVWSRSQMGKMPFNPTRLDIQPMVNDVILRNSEKLDKKKIKVENGIKPKTVILSDRDMTVSVFQNLISNAIKFNKEEGTIKIKTKEKPGFLEFSIEDSGIGISKEDLNKLFRIDVHYTEIGNSKERGTGLGLIICKEFVEKHGGKLSIESKESEWTRVTFSFPVK
ncbi:MAG: PAS domain-containing protein [Melioribacteraceae bacterium]|nr:PAS domain-containing protein [Melioribacteraceae bacterium]MCF8396509.1 PAS domain-containing protein [Melioribacteraceae bacterium]